MNEKVKTKSPKHPSWDLSAAITQANEVYKRERRNFAPMDIIAKHLGYSGINNGAALTAFSTLSQFALLIRTPDGRGSISADLEKFQHAPTPEIKKTILLKWAKSPKIFNKIFEKYPHNPPSEATLKYDLIELGFSVKAAETCSKSFLETAEYVNYYDKTTQFNVELLEENCNDSIASENADAINREHETIQPVDIRIKSPRENDALFDRIPIRLHGGRRAYLEIPSPMYEKDKQIIVNQVNMLLADEEHLS